MGNARSALLIPVEKNRTSSGAESQDLKQQLPQHSSTFKPSMILSKKLYVGSRLDGMSCKLKNPLKATHVLCLEATGRYPDSKSKLHYMIEPMSDGGATDLESFWEKVKDFVIEGAERRLVIHCHCGVNRGPTVAIMYLILVKKYSYEDAFALVSSKRPEMNIHPRYLKQLQSL